MINTASATHATRESEIIARVELELKYAFRREETSRILGELYQDVMGKAPRKRFNLLSWFFDNYKFNVAKESWYKIEPVLH